MVQTQVNIEDKKWRSDEVTCKSPNHGWLGRKSLFMFIDEPAKLQVNKGSEGKKYFSPRVANNKSEGIMSKTMGN